MKADLTNNFFERGPTTRVFENLVLAIETRDDDNRFLLLFGQNTQMLSREDNLPSGNLPTINRSLIPEAHRRGNDFGKVMRRRRRRWIAALAIYSKR